MPRQPETTPLVTRVEIHRGPRHVVYRLVGSRGDSCIHKTIRIGARSFASAHELRHEHAVLQELRNVDNVARPVALMEIERLPTLVVVDAGPHNVKEFLRSKPLGIDVFLSFAIQLAETVGKVHARHLVHRDINPANVVVSRDGKRLTLIDFGIATPVEGATQPQAAPTELEGTLLYIAPEQTGRMSLPVDHRADLYSLGATYYEMLTGAPPFVLSDPVEIVHAHLARAPIPPYEINEAVPKPLSDIVLKLLAKAPERRYQSAEAVVEDLREAERRWKATRRVEEFELGRLDVARELLPPARLYGRERELALLHAAYDRVRSGGREVVLISGDAGAGKSVLAREVQSYAAPHGTFLSGSFGPLGGNMPYASILEAFRGFVEGLLSQPETVRRQIARRIEDAMGPNMGVVVEVLPELRALVGAPPPVPDVGAAAAEHRFGLTFMAFVQSLATESAPLVLFLDDLQWADPASLKLFWLMATHVELRYFLLIGAYRKVDRDAEAPLSRMRRALESDDNVSLSTIAVEPLGVDALVELCADTLRTTRERTKPLAEIVHAKTAGNPFFVGRFLRHLHQLGLLVFEIDRCRWEWDEGRIVALDVTENVADLMVAVIRRLSPTAKHLVEVAACLPGRIDLGLLSDVAGVPTDEAARGLWGPLREGLLTSETVGPRRRSHDAEASYRFAHDRVREAAYSLLPVAERHAVHLAAGWRLLEEAQKRGRDEELFAAVDQLNRGVDLVREEAQRYRIAELDLRAGQKARAASAFGPALSYFAAGIDLFPEGVPDEHRSVWIALRRDAAECAYLAGDRPLAEGLIDVALEHARTPLERADLKRLRIDAATAQLEFQDALRWGREALAEVGADLPPDAELPGVLLAEFKTLDEQLAGRPFESLATACEMRDPRARMTMQLLATVDVAAWFTADKPIFGLACVRQVALTVAHGHSAESAVAYVYYGIMVAQITRDRARGYAFASLGVDLAKHYRSRDPRAESRALGVFATFVSFWHEPLQSGASLLRRGTASALQGGDVLGANWNMVCALTTLWCAGVELGRIQSECGSGIATMRRLGQAAVVPSFLPVRQAIRCLQGRTRALGRFDDDEFDERAFIASRPNPSTLGTYFILRLVASYVFQRFEEADSVRQEAGEVPWLAQIAIHVDANVYGSLTDLARCEGAPPERREELLANVARNQARLGRWAEACPENFAHRYQLVAAELARVKGAPFETVLALYDRAIDGAENEGFLQDESVATELAARCCLSAGRVRTGAYYMQAAIDAYSRWGATAKVELLEEELAGLPMRRRPLRAGNTPATPEREAAPIDLLGLLEAAETISSEMVFDRLVEKLVGVCLATAGATRGVLILEERRGLVVWASGGASEPVAIEATPLEGSGLAPATLVEHVFEIGEAVVLADAARQGRFVKDPFIVARAVKSALGLPIRLKGKPIGVFYLENDLTTHAFSPRHVRVLDALSSQIAIALENSRLFEAQQRAERSARFLAEAGATLAESLDYPTTLSKVARLAVQFLADWCKIDLVERDGTIIPVAAAHADPEKEPILRELRTMFVQGGPESPTGHVIRTGEPLVRPEMTDEELANEIKDERILALVRQLGIRSSMSVPLIVRKRTLGALSFISTRRGRRYGRSDLALATELGRRAALAIDNARLFRDSEAAIRLRDEFLQVASHELRTPITSLQLTVQHLLRYGLSSPRETILRGLTTVERQGWKLDELIQEMLDVSCMHAGLHLAIEPVDLSEVARYTVVRLAEALAAAGCAVTLRADDPVVGRWDRTQLERVVVHLLSNAMKFGAGKPIEVTVSSQQKAAQLVVVDHGIGVAPERIPHIFDRFVRGVSASHYGGLGLGLYVVRAIVTALGGTVRAESTLGQGATLTVELPLGN